MSDPQPGVKYDAGKTDWTLLPWSGLQKIVEVLEYGARKYTRPLPSPAHAVSRAQELCSCGAIFNQDDADSWETAIKALAMHRRDCESRQRVVVENGVLVETGRGNWRLVENARERYLKAAFRHLIAYAGGEELDPKEAGGSGLSHLGHLGCCVLFLLALPGEKTS